MIKHETIRQLIDARVNEILLAYQSANNITNGDIHPLHALNLENAKNALAEAIQVICISQERAVNYDDLARFFMGGGKLYKLIVKKGEKHGKFYEFLIIMSTFANSRELSRFVNNINN